MPKSRLATKLDAIQRSITPMLKSRDFRVTGRTYNRLTADGLTQVVNLQMGSFDPPGTTYIPGLRDNLYGLFTVNLGVYVPEVAGFHGGGEAKSFVREYHCCLRARLGELGPEHADFWWSIDAGSVASDELLVRLKRDAFPYFERYESRTQIVSELEGHTENYSSGGPPRITCAIILARRGERERARVLLAEQANEPGNPGHSAYVRELAERIGVGQLDG